MQTANTRWGCDARTAYNCCLTATEIATLGVAGLDFKTHEVACGADMMCSPVGLCLLAELVLAASAQLDCIASYCLDCCTRAIVLSPALAKQVTHCRNQYTKHAHRGHRSITSAKKEPNVDTRSAKEETICPYTVSCPKAERHWRHELSVQPPATTAPAISQIRDTPHGMTCC